MSTPGSPEPKASYRQIEGLAQRELVEVEAYGFGAHGLLSLLSSSG